MMRSRADGIQTVSCLKFSGTLKVVCCHLGNSIYMLEGWVEGGGGGGGTNTGAIGTVSREEEKNAAGAGVILASLIT